MRSFFLKGLLALLITLSAAVYQRMTGPTYPLKGEDRVEDQMISYTLPRSHGQNSDKEVRIPVPNDSVDAFLVYRRYKTADQWMRISMQQKGDYFKALLPQQPPAGKLEYFVLYKMKENNFTLPQKETVIIRFRGEVPAFFLVPHIVFMFLAMFFSNLSAIEVLLKGRNIRLLVSLTCITLFAGGMILGPVVQKHAFGAFWTGIPLGFDLTDNKTLFAMIGWLVAFVQVIRSRPSSRWWVLGAALLLLLIFSIPHSMLGSELDYETMNVVTGD